MFQNNYFSAKQSKEGSSNTALFALLCTEITALKQNCKAVAEHMMMPTKLRLKPKDHMLLEKASIQPLFFCPFKIDM